MTGLCRSSASSGRGRSPRLALPLLLFPVVAIYGSFLGNPLFFDDSGLVGILGRGIEGLLGIYQRVLAWLSFAVEREWFDAGAAGHRVGNLAIHVGVVVLAFGLGRQLLAVGGVGRDRITWLAAAAALLLSLHPVAAFAVGYLIQRTVLLSTLFALIATWCHLNAQLKDDGRWYLGAAVAFLLSVFSKEHSVALPGVLAVLSYWLHRAGHPWRWRHLWAFVTYGAISVGITLLVQSGVGIGVIYEPRVFPIDEVTNPHQVSIATQLVLFFKYLGLWLVPMPQAMSIDIQHDLPAHVWPWWGLAGGVAFAGAGLAACWQLHRNSAWALPAFVLLWAQGLFVTEFWAVRLAETFVLYRSYLWFVLLPVAAVFLVDRLLARAKLRESCRLGLLAAGATSCAILLTIRLQVFASPLHAWQEAVEHNSGVSWVGAGRAFSNVGFQLTKQGRVAEAAAHFHAAVSTNPVQATTWCNLATYYVQRRDWAAFRHAVSQVLKYEPSHPCLDPLRQDRGGGPARY